MKTIKQAKACYIICSLLFVAAGITIIALPRMSSLVICYIVGGISLLYGITKILGYISRDLYNLAFQFDLSLGIFSAAMGAILLLIPDRIINFLPVIIGLCIMIDGVFKLQTAIDAKRFGLPSWWVILLGAIVCIVLSFLLVFNPFEGANALMVLVGISLFFDGLQNLFNAFYTVKIMKQTKERFK